MQNLNKIIPLLCLVFFSSITQATPIKIGFIGPRTGSAAATGTAFQEGIDLALDDLKAKGSPLEVIFEDTAGVPEKAAAAFEKLVNKDKVSMVLGESHSSSALVEIELSNRYQVPFVISEAWSDALLQKGYPSVFRAGPYNSHVVNSAIAGFINEGHFKNVSIIHENSDWGKGITALTIKALDEHKVKHNDIEVDLKAKDFYAELNKLKSEKPDLIIAYIYSFGLHTFVSQAGEIGVTPSSLILDGAGTPSLWAEFWPNVGKSGNNELFVSSMHPEVKPNVQAKLFWENYKKKYGKDPSDYKSRSGYTMVLLAADVLSRAKSTSSKEVILALEKTKFSGPAGEIHFGTQTGTEKYHQWAPDMLIAQWQDQKQAVVFPKKYATGKLRK